MVGLDIFTGKKYEETSQTSHKMDVPVVTKTEYPLMNLNADTGAVSLLRENGEASGVHEPLLVAGWLVDVGVIPMNHATESNQLLLYEPFL